MLYSYSGQLIFQEKFLVLCKLYYLYLMIETYGTFNMFFLSKYWLHNIFLRIMKLFKCLIWFPINLSFWRQFCIKPSKESPVSKKSWLTIHYGALHQFLSAFLASHGTQNQWINSKTLSWETMAKLVSWITKKTWESSHVSKSKLHSCIHICAYTYCMIFVFK